MFKVGAEYTFTVRKTNDGYEAVATTENGTQTQKLTANDFTSVQEDGTVVVGVMVARKIGVKITDIKFTTSESKGLATSEVVEDKVTPSIRVYSSNTCGAGEYEYTVVPNCAGTLKVTGSADGKAISKEVTADEVVRIPVTVNVGSNTIKAEFEPAAAANITSTKTVASETNVTRKVYGEAGQTIIVTPDGKTTGDGTEESPLDINTAVSYAQPGQTILMKNGVYDKWITINRSVCGTADKPINLVAESISTDGTDGVVLIGDAGHEVCLRIAGIAGGGVEGGDEADDVSAPGGDGEQSGDGRRGGVRDVGQLLTGDLGLIGDGTHHVTHEQGGEVVGEEHQNTQRSAHDLSNAGRDVKLLIELVGHGLNGAGLLEEGHHDTDEHLDTDDPDEIGIAQSTLNDAGEAEQQVLTGDEQTHQNAAQDGEQGFSRNERQDNGDQSRSQRKDTIIIHIYLLKFSYLF